MTNGAVTVLFGLLPEGEWQQDAACLGTDTEAFFPEKGGSTREAKRICRDCPVTAECLRYALDRRERFGIYGGLSERERRRMYRLPSSEERLDEGAAA